MRCHLACALFIPAKLVRITSLVCLRISLVSRRLRGFGRVADEAGSTILGPLLPAITTSPEGTASGGNIKHKATGSHKVAEN